MHVSSHKDSAGELCFAGSIFSMKSSGFMSKAIYLLLTEFVVQCKNILLSAFFGLTYRTIREMPREIYSCTERATQLTRA